MLFQLLVGGTSCLNLFTTKRTEKIYSYSSSSCFMRQGSPLSYRSTIFWGETLTQQQHPRKFRCLTSVHNNETLRQRVWPFIVINPQVTRITVGHFCQLTIFVLLSWFTPSVPWAHFRWHPWWWKVIDICTVVSGAPWGYQRRVSLAFSDASPATHSQWSRENPEGGCITVK